MRWNHLGILLKLCSGDLGGAWVSAFPTNSQVSGCGWSRNDTLTSEALKRKSLPNLCHPPPPRPLHGSCNHPSNPTRYYLPVQRRNAISQTTGGSPRTQPGLLVFSPLPVPRIILEAVPWAVALPTAGFSSAPRVWQWGIGFHQKSLAPRAIQKSTSSHVPLPLSPLGQESKKVPSLLETQALANGVSWPGTSGWLSFQSRLPHVLASSRAALQPHRQRVRGLTAGLGCLSSTPPPTEDSVFSRSWPQLRLSLLLTLPPSGHRSAHQCQALDAEVMEAD